MIRCDNCGTNNVDGSDYCDECGMKLDQLSRPVPRKRDAVPIYQPPSAVESEPVASNTMDGPLPAPPSFTTSTSIPKPAMPARERKSSPEARPSNANPRRSSMTNERSSPAFPASEKRPKPVPSSQTYALSSPPHTGELDSDVAANPAGLRLLAKLTIERGGRVGKEFQVSGIEINIGRWDADSGIFPDVDLDEDDAEAKVSRRHARIVNHNGQYFIEDLSSTNGTFVNRGRRLLPGKRHMLQNGDEIIVGKTFLKFQILK